MILSRRWTLALSKSPPAGSATDQVAPSEVILGDQIQCPRTKEWFVVAGIRIRLAPSAQQTFRRHHRFWGDTYCFSGADGELINFFEGQQSVHRAVAIAG
jgi:hypothetical protein